MSWSSIMQVLETKPGLSSRAQMLLTTEYLSSLSAHSYIQDQHFCSKVKFWEWASSTKFRSLLLWDAENAK